MNLSLGRVKKCADGIFSKISELELCSIEHAYVQPDGSWEPKIPPGTYICIRGIHCLSNGIPFETFEITGVEGHTGLLFHCGNTNAASEGCVCTGGEIVGNMVTHSRIAFAAFMTAQEDVDQFLLFVQ